jgi:hypothetical protein
VDDDEVMSRIDALIEEEHGLHARAGDGRGLTEDEHDRLRELEVRLDQCWDLLRQRRARRHAGQDPDQAEVRPENIVERYRQ